MFSFGKKKPSIIVRDLIWITEDAKHQAILNECKKNSQTIVGVWFDSTYRNLEKLFSENELPPAPLLMVRELAGHYLTNNTLIFAEHHPLHEKETALFEKLNLSAATFYSSLDEPLLARFGGEKISGMVRAMGLKDDEALEHSLISSSIKNAQQKIAEKVMVEQPANSPSEWFLFNLE